jgi:hypothetical protein
MVQAVWETIKGVSDDLELNVPQSQLTLYPCTFHSSGFVD